jgi:hypothetical protein
MNCAPFCFIIKLAPLGVCTVSHKKHERGCKAEEPARTLMWLATVAMAIVVALIAIAAAVVGVEDAGGERQRGAEQ